MKRLHILVGLMLIGGTLMAQNNDTAAADKHYNSLEYVDAAAAYEKMVTDGQGNPYVYKQLADSYYNVFKTKSAVVWYAKATETPQDAETFYRYAQMLKGEGNYPEANKQMAIFAKMAPSDQRAITFIADPEYLPKLRSQTKLFEEKSASVNSNKSDFGAVLTSDNNLYFASARNTAKRTAGWDDEPYLDLYQSIYNADGTFSEPIAVSALNTRWHEGPATMSNDGSTIYFSSESFNEKEFGKDKKNRLKKGQVYLYKAAKEGDKWGKAIKLPFNNKAYSIQHPAMSKDGKTLYFSSNMPGSFGGFDLYKVAVADGSYGAPENLGKAINTEGNEGFPFLTDEGKLYFSSDAHQGFGGLDVFTTDLTVGKIVNVGAPVNTDKDDFAFTFNTVKKTGFFSSNRDGNDNIYQVTPICNTEVIATVKDATTGDLLANAKVSILDDRNNVIQTTESKSNGQVQYVVDCGKTFMLQISNEGYESGSFPIVKTDGKTVNVAANLKPIANIITLDAVVLSEIFFEYDKSNISREGAFELDKLVEAFKSIPTMVILVKAHTDNRGTAAYNLALSERRVASTVQYILSKGIAKDRISGKGVGQSEPKITCEPCTEAQHQANRRSEFLIVKN